VKALTARQIIRILEANDFQVSRQRGSHVIYKHTTTGRIVPVPLHGGNKTLPIGTFLSIVKQSGIDREDFRIK
jgi:predicted RNA binding protein YcfA (HicA-like mRNA interferase family)